MSSGFHQEVKKMSIAEASAYPEALVKIILEGLNNSYNLTQTQAGNISPAMAVNVLLNLATKPKLTDELILKIVKLTLKEFH